MERNIKWPHLPGHNKTTFTSAFPQKWFLPPPSPIKTKAGPFRCQILNWHLPFMSQRNLRWFWSVLALPPPHICLSLLLCSSMYQEGLHPWIFDWCKIWLPLTAFRVQTTAVLFSMSWHQGIKEKDANQAPPPNLPLCIANVVSMWYLNLKCWLL